MYDIFKIYNFNVDALKSFLLNKNTIRSEWGWGRMAWPQGMNIKSKTNLNLLNQSDCSKVSRYNF